MADDRPVLHKKTLKELKDAAIAELERRGYDIRGKTPAQIRHMLKRQPARPKFNVKSLGQTVASSQDTQTNLTRGQNLTGGKRG